MDYSQDIKGVKCNCGYTLNIATSGTQEPPEPGAVLLCMYCGALYRFNKKKSPTPVALEKILERIDPAEREEFLRYREQAIKFGEQVRAAKARMN
jgi:hypothetical protein